MRGLQQNANVDKYFDSRQCLQPAYKASASRACLLLQEDGPCPSCGCVVSRAELERRLSATGRKVAESGKRKEVGSRSEASDPLGGHWNCLRQAEGSPLAEPLRGVGVGWGWRLSCWKNSKYLKSLGKSISPSGTSTVADFSRRKSLHLSTLF